METMSWRTIYRHHCYHYKACGNRHCCLLFIIHYCSYWTELSGQICHIPLKICDMYVFQTLTCHLVLSQLRKSYGDVYSLFIGSKPAVIINGVKAMKEALVTNATDFAGRPKDLFINDVIDRKGRTHNMSQGRAWITFYTCNVALSMHILYVGMERLPVLLNSK